jgi:hypothetical protein
MVATMEELTGVEHKHEAEDALTSKIEDTTKEIPSGTFLAAGVAMMGVSALLALAGRKQAANFFGQWVPTILIMGLYNKLVKARATNVSHSNAGRRDHATRLLREPRKCAAQV